jgi:hypothetical protein
VLARLWAEVAGDQRVNVVSAEANASAAEADGGQFPARREARDRAERAAE